MKRKITRILCAALALCALLCTGALAAGQDTDGIMVRVNGKTVRFPDGQPYIDENGRTMIPVRFVTEELGAAVSWDGDTQTVRIVKDGTQVSVRIGSETLVTEKNGIVSRTEMDTAAVLKDSRTYVPLRFVAVALGAAVDYSDVYAAAGIWSEALTAEQIALLQSLPYTASAGASSYEKAKKSYDGSTLGFFYGTDRESFGNFANAREHLYAYTQCAYLDYSFPELGITLNRPAPDRFFREVVREAAAETDYVSERLTVTFTADPSCIYQEDNMNNNTCTVRGIATAHLHVKPSELQAAETAMLCRLGFTQLYQDRDISVPVDVHMNTASNFPVSVNCFVPAGTSC